MTIADTKRRTVRGRQNQIRKLRVCQMDCDEDTEETLRPRMTTMQLKADKLQIHPSKKVARDLKTVTDSSKVNGGSAKERD